MNKVCHGDCVEVMATFPDGYIDLTITSPPYDNLRDYNGYTFDFEGIAKQLYRITKDGGVVVWVVGDATIKGSETGTSFKQALYFKEIGFNLHDTMIYGKDNFQKPCSTRYWSCFEYMFVFSKGKPKSANLICDRKNKKAGQKMSKNTIRNKDGTMAARGDTIIKNFGKRINIWMYNVGYLKPTLDKVAYQHPAIFPEQLANDHILTWSNEGDLVLDPMCGSGTTCKMAMVNNRNYIGIDISEEYCEIARKRLSEHKQQLVIGVT